MKAQRVNSLALCIGVMTLSAWTSMLAQTGKPAASCESLAKLSLPNTTITLAKTLGAGEFQFPPHPPNSSGYPNMDVAKLMPAICQVVATLKPSSDSIIKIEVWLPLTGWNGKLLAEGNGNGFGGRASHSGMATAVIAGYATTSSDSGHDVVEDKGGASYLVGHPEKLIDLGYRAVHEMTVVTKALIATYYGAPPRHSYYTGSRLGGFQGLTEASRYPEDYDGIIAESPVISFALDSAAAIWEPWLIAQDKSRTISKEKLAMVHEAVLKECDALDGVKDGNIENPLACHFDPQSLICKGEDALDCLTTPQVELLKRLCQGPVNPRTGKSIVAGMVHGAESAMLTITPLASNGEPNANEVDVFRYIVYKNPNWNWKTIDWDTDVENAMKATASTLTADSHLKPYADHGGKLLITSNWASNPGLVQVIDYHNGAVKNMGPAKAASALRLYMLSGDFRQAGSAFDRLAVLEQWVEQGKAPDRIVATYESAGKPRRTHPLCAYPKVAQYKGTGDSDKEENFVCEGSKLGVKP